MVQLNLALREINCKVVYFGCGLSGKTTNLEVIHEKAAPDSRGELTSIATESDRTLFFDFMPLDLGTVSGMKVKFQLYTVPGQVYYNSTRKLVLRGADGVIFVADSNPAKVAENKESFENLKECLAEQGRSLDEMPYVVQLNKRDLPEAMSHAAMREALGLAEKAPVFEAIASRGDGVLETFKALAGFLLERVKSMSTESSAKPTVQAQRLAQRTEASRPQTGAQRLQGGLGAGAISTPSKVNSQSLDRRAEPAAPAAASAAPPAAAAPAASERRASARSAAVVAPAVRPSVRAASTSGASAAAAANPITTNAFKTIGTQSMMVCSSARRKRSKAPVVALIVVTLVVAAAAAAVVLMK